MPLLDHEAARQKAIEDLKEKHVRWLAKTYRTSRKDAEAIFEQWDPWDPDEELPEEMVLRRLMRPQEVAVLDRLSYWTNAGAQSFVYFVQSGWHGPVKIGKAASPLTRLAELQTGNPEALNLRHIMVGNRSLERALHKQFARAKLRAEWFRSEWATTIFCYAENLAQVQYDHHKDRGEIVESFDRLCFIEEQYGGAAAA